MHDFTAAVVGVVFWGAVTAIVIVPLYFRHRERLRMQDTLRVALEKGQSVPTELIEGLQAASEPRTRLPTPQRDLRAGLVLIATGVGVGAVGLGLWNGLMTVSETAADITGGCVAGGAAIPFLIGVAHLLLWSIGRRGPQA